MVPNQKKTATVGRFGFVGHPPTTLATSKHQPSPPFGKRAHSHAQNPSSLQPGYVVGNRITRTTGSKASLFMSQYEAKHPCRDHTRSKKQSSSSPSASSSPSPRIMCLPESKQRRRLKISVRYMARPRVAVPQGQPLARRVLPPCLQPASLLLELAFLWDNDRPFQMKSAGRKNENS